MEHEATSVNSFDDWYTHREVVDFGTRMGCLDFKGLTSLASGYLGNYTRFKREMDVRCTGFEKLEMLADNEVISPKDDLPNVSSGETAGIVRRMARNLVQNTPNVEVVSTRIIYASTRRSATLVAFQPTVARWFSGSAVPAEPSGLTMCSRPPPVSSVVP